MLSLSSSLLGLTKHILQTTQANTNIEIRTQINYLDQDPKWARYKRGSKNHTRYQNLLMLNTNTNIERYTHTFMRYNLRLMTRMIVNVNIPKYVSKTTTAKTKPATPATTT